MSNIPQSANIVSGRDVTAVLGPTNTGKTHLAIERMVAHESGIIGLPLRLLAREVYGRVVEKVGRDAVALITGEEKIVPPNARFQVCTVEAMPTETDCAFAAIDEVQLAGDLERGHIFTDRLLHIRGHQETLLLGAATMRGRLESLLPGLNVVTRPRLSQLTYAGSKKITRLPRRSAVVAFSADEVYAIGELIRRQRGGVAIVMGALSPRTRNAQVALYQSGEVDYLVATDAIGMGLNLDVDHVAFAQNRKFDGYQYRDLNAAELAQIAGRAGRHIRDGSFGVTGQVEPFDERLIEQIEAHDFAPVKMLQWRNSKVDYSSCEALLASLDKAPHLEGLTRALPATDQKALEFVLNDPDITSLANTPDAVETLWAVCALPDYRRIAPAQHADIVSTIYKDLMQGGCVNEGYMAEQVVRADDVSGEIDTLSHRIAQIRTWTYVANRSDWLKDPVHWQARTREVENKLSDALHEKLMKRFVDRKTSVLMKRLRENAMLEVEIAASGTVNVEGHALGELQGFRFSPTRSETGPEAKAANAAASKALAQEFEHRATKFSTAPNGDLAIGSDGYLRWLGAPIGTLVSDEHWLSPRLVLLADEQLTGKARDMVAERGARFVSHHIQSQIKPLADLHQADQLQGIARGVAFRLVENYGVLDRRDVASEIKSLDQEARAALRRFGVRFGAYHIFIPGMIKPAPAGLIALLWAIGNNGMDKPGYGDVVNSLSAGRTSMPIEDGFDHIFYRLAGYRAMGERAVRIDILERLADLVRPAVYWKAESGQAVPDGAFGQGAFFVTPAMMSILGASHENMNAILKELGYRHQSVPKPEFDQILARLDPEKYALTPAAEPVAFEQLPADEALLEEEPAEVEQIQVWRLRGPSGARTDKKSNRQQNRSRRNDGPGRGKQGAKFNADNGRRNKKSYENRPKGQTGKSAQKIDPDSPFAKLAALKEQMNK